MFYKVYKINMFRWENGNTLSMGNSSSSYSLALEKQIYRNAIQRMYDLKLVYTKKQYDDKQVLATF